MRKKKNACKVSTGKPARNRPLGRPRCRWEANIKMDIKEIGWGMCAVDSSGSR
jgi:hypothetical protein